MPWAVEIIEHHIKQVQFLSPMLYTSIMKRGFGKYGVAAKERRTAPDGTVFASLGEMQRYFELLQLHKTGLIGEVKKQVIFPIKVNGLLICNYQADFVYMENNQQIVEDWKGVRTPAFNLKNKLMKAVYGIDLRITGKKARTVLRKRKKSV